MLLTDLLKCGIKFNSIDNFPKDFEVKGLTEDSRKVGKDFLFAAIKGSSINGEDYIDAAIKNGAKIILSAEKKQPAPGVIYITHDNPRFALGNLAAKFFNNAPEFVAAVTGTNGKTSVVNFCRQIWHYLGKKPASIGTIGVTSGLHNEVPLGFSMTTPGTVELHNIVAKLAKDKVTNLAIEASSHGLDQARMAGLKINVGAFTNITRDHLDYHKTMANYFSAKMKLFTDAMDEKSHAVINADIDEFKEIEEVCKKCRHKIISYGKNGKEVRLIKNTFNENGINLELEILNEKFQLSLPLYGEFQAANILCSIGIILASGFSAKAIIAELGKIKTIEGRMQFSAKKANGAKIFVDYAHTPDALENVLKSVRGHMPKNGKLYVVFGCGGNRDKGKRQIMGGIADKFADFVFVTDDNPRNEDPVMIRKEILSQCKKGKEFPDREKAIGAAIEKMESNDFLIIAGKGHEKTQIIGNNELPFDDVEVAKRFAEGKKK